MRGKGTRKPAIRLLAVPLPGCGGSAPEGNSVEAAVFRVLTARLYDPSGPSREKFPAGIMPE